MITRIFIDITVARIPINDQILWLRNLYIANFLTT